MVQLNCLWFDDEKSIVWVMCFTIRERIRYWTIELCLHPRGINWNYWLLNWEQSSKAQHILNTEGEINELKLSDFSGNRILFIERKKKKKKRRNFSPKTRNLQINQSILSLNQAPAFGETWKNWILLGKR